MGKKHKKHHKSEKKDVELEGLHNIGPEMTDDSATPVRKQTTLSEKKKIVDLHESGMSISAIASDVERSKSAVHRIISRNKKSSTRMPKEDWTTSTSQSYTEGRPDNDEKPPTEKPLKLVLKVTEPVAEVYTGESEERRHKHKKKKKKKSSEKEKHRHHDDDRPRKRGRDEYEGEGLSQSSSCASPASKRHAYSVTSTPNPMMMERPKQEAEESVDKKLQPPSVNPEDEEPKGFKMFLQYMTQLLQRKDNHGFFAFPVNDIIAPGYSSIIQKPMDFSTMNNKVEDDYYSSTSDYKKDFVLMCQNAMIYNRPETIYYKEARRLLHSGVKQFTKENLLIMKRTLNFMESVTLEELGITEESEANDVALLSDDNDPDIDNEQAMKEKKQKKQKTCLSRFEAIPDNMTPEEILAQAQEAAKEAADLLTLREPKAQFAFLRRRKDGSTSLTILNPDNDGKVSDTEKVINLGAMANKLASGTGVLSSFKEDKRNKISPVSYLSYGPFSSYAPSFDSSFANITKEESDLLLNAYGDETAVQYAKSIMSFAETTGDATIKIVDSLLDSLTNGEHSKVQGVIDSRRKEETKKQAQATAELDQAMAAVDSGKQKKETLNVDFNSLKSLSSDLQMDFSFLDYFEKEITKEKELQQKLDYTAGLIQDLHSTQHDRLSAKPPVHLAFVPGPSQKETQLANKVTQELRELAKQANPSGVVSVRAIRNSMGVAAQPFEGTDLISSAFNASDLDPTNPSAPSATPISTGGAGNNTLPMDFEQELNEFLEQDPLNKACESPKDVKNIVEQMITT